MTHPLPTPNFPVDWQTPQDAQLLWMRDRIHWPHSITPLEYDWWHGTTEGLNAANRFYRMPGLARVGRFNTYLYTTSEPLPATDNTIAAIGDSEARLLAVAAHLQSHWQEEWLPEIKQHLAFWEGTDLTNLPLPDLIQHLAQSYPRHVRLWEIHFLLFWPLSLALNQLIEFYSERFTGGSALAAYDLLSGLSNKTVESGALLWKLSRKVLSSSSLHQVLSLPHTTQVLTQLASTAEGRTFLADLQAYLQEYGQRGAMWGLRYPTWIEDPTPVLNTLRDYCNQPKRDLTQEMADLAAKRRQCIAETRQRLIDSPATLQKFDALLQTAEVANVLSEDHTYWIDFRTSYQVRRLLLECGRRLVQGHLLASVDEIFCLRWAEVEAALTHLQATSPIAGQEPARCSDSYRSLIAERQAELARFATVEPPAMLGTPPSPQAWKQADWSRSSFWQANEKLNGSAPQPVPQQPSSKQPLRQPIVETVVQGRAASAGTYRGVARVVMSLAEAQALQRGEVLIAMTTAPPWTPLFAIAGAVVTEVGGVLSHSAVVAREYGIPAVVGAQGITTRIQSGATVEVDGAAGVVRVVSAKEVADGSDFLTL